MSSIATVAYAPQITAAAERHHLDPALLAAVAAQETGGPGRTSGANVVGDGGHGHGLFQIDDRYHAFARTPAAMDPASNADYAAGLLQGLLQKYGGDVHAALSAYNAGSPTATGTTTDWGNGMQVGYADSVLMHYEQFGGTSAVAGGEGAATGATALAARDAAVPDLAEASALTNQLRSLSSGATGTMMSALGSAAYSPTAAQVESAFGSSSSSAVASIPCPTVPQSTPPSQAQQAQKETALVEDLGNGDDSGDADPSQAVRSS